MKMELETMKVGSSITWSITKGDVRATVRTSLSRRFRVTRSPTDDKDAINEASYKELNGQLNQQWYVINQQIESLNG